ncbi:DNA polymerase I, partial [Psychrobacter sp. 1Y4]
MNILYLDLETFSETPIKHGTYKYAADAEILLFAYAWNDEPAKVFDLTGTADYRMAIEDLLADADVIIAHNSMFDRNVLKANGFNADLSKWRDTMIKAYSHSL